jgi:hypothetical protein
MKELLFGWLLKPNYKVTTLDGVIGCIEFIILFIIGVFIYTWISDIRDRRNK